jgi:hypothetical protein
MSITFSPKPRRLRTDALVALSLAGLALVVSAPRAVLGVR